MSKTSGEQLAESWPESGQFPRSIRLEFSLYVSGLIILLMAVTGYIITEQYVKTVTQNVVDKLVVQARSYSGPAGKHIIASEQPDALMLSNVCKRLLDDNPEIYWVGITDQENQFIAHTDIRHVVASEQFAMRVGQSEFSDMIRDGEAFMLVSDTMFVTVPIVENDISLGQLAVASATDQIAAARLLSITTVATITIIMILLGIPITTFILHRKLKPIASITNALRDVDVNNISIEAPVKSRNEFGFLSETLRVMGARLNLAQQEALENERISRELEIAREIQTNILPRNYPLKDELEFAGVYESAREVGGDYYDFIDHGDGRFGFLVADVSGKSLPGMLVMLLTRDIIRQVSRTEQKPGDVLKHANRELRANIKPGMFVTMFFGVLDRTTGRFEFASAGHNPLLVIRSSTGMVEEYNPKGYPLGMIGGKQFDARLESAVIDLKPGDDLIQFTDGVNEAQDGGKEEFGMERFLASLRAHHHFAPRELVEAVLADLQGFVGDAPQYDDITLLAMKWYGHSVDIKREQMERAEHVD